MTAKWLGHENLCPSQWRRPCSCPCPSCDEPLDTPAPDGCGCKALHQPPVDLFKVLDEMSVGDEDEEG